MTKFRWTILVFLLIPVIFVIILKISFKFRDFSGVYQSRSGYKAIVSLSGPGYFSYDDSLGNHLTFNIGSTGPGMQVDDLLFYYPVNDLKFYGYDSCDPKGVYKILWRATLDRGEKSLEIFNRDTLVGKIYQTSAGGITSRRRAREAAANSVSQPAGRKAADGLPSRQCGTAGGAHRDTAK